MPESNRARGAGLLLLIALLLLGALTFVRKGTRGTSELPVYTVGAQRMLRGEEIYRRSDAKPFTYPPFFALPFTVLGEVPMEAPRPWPAYVAWYLVNAAALLGIVALLHRRLVRGRVGAVPFWALCALLAGRHVTAVFENQSHDLLVFLLVVLGVEAWCRGRDRGAGGWFGIAAACKATPLLFALPLLLRRRWPALIGMAAALVVATLLPDLLAPRADGRLWVAAWVATFVADVSPGATASSAGAWTAGSVLNQSLSGTLHRLMTPVADQPQWFVFDAAVVDAGPGVRRAMTLLASAAVLALVGWAAVVSARAPATETEVGLRRLGVGAAVVCGMVLLSPMSSKSHFCVLLLPVAFCTAHVLGGHRDGLLIGLGAGVALLGTATIKGLVGSRLGNWFLAHGSVTWTAALALVGTVRALQVRSRGVA